MNIAALFAYLLLILIQPGLPSAPNEELLRLVPDDVDFCLVLSDLRGRHERLMQSPWMKNAENTPLGKALKEAPELAKLAGLDEPLRKSLGVSWARFRDDILGDAVVLAYRGGPGGKQELDQGILMLHARDRDLLARLVARLNQEQLENGDLNQVEERLYKGLKYSRRAEAKGESFYHLDGPILAWTAQESLLRQVLDRRADAQGQLKRLPLPAQAKQAGSAAALATIWVNPKAVEGEFEAEAGAAAPAEAQALKAFLRYWKALDGVSVSLLVEGEPEIVLGLHAQAAKLPPAAQRLTAQAGIPSDLWGRFPQDSLLTVASRAELMTLAETLGEFLLPEQRKTMSESVRHGVGLPLSEAFVKQVLPQFGSDWGLCVLPSADRTGPPLTLFAMGIRPAPGKAPAGKGLVGLVQMSVGLGIFERNLKNKDNVQLRKEMQDGVEVQYLAGDKTLPAEVRPSIAMKGGYLLLANSPEAVKRFAAVGSPTPADQGAPLLRVSLRHLARFLKDRPDEAPGLLGLDRGLPLEQARGLVAGMVGAMERFDAVDLRQHGTDGQITWTVRLRAAAQDK